jgi:ABC-2 type transport system ATP-binding protein
MSKLLKVEGLERTFGSTRAVQGLSFSISRGSIVGFIGPNGAGKTTTIRMLATLEHPDAGDAWLDGTSIIDYPDRVRRRIGYMPDYYGTYPDTTVLDYLDFFTRAYGVRGPRVKETVDRLVNFTGMEGIASKQVSALSKGMKQRLSLARTLVHDPDLLVLDEPAAGLDPRARVTFRELLRVLADQGKAILISSHILTELSELVDGCLIIERGCLVLEGDVQSVRETVRERAREHALDHTEILRIGLLEPVARHEQVLLEQPFVQRVSGDGRLLEVTYGGDATAATQLLRTLVQAGWPVFSFSVREANLEDVFLAATKGEVQ